jgi:hypothetical protein
MKSALRCKGSGDVPRDRLAANGVWYKQAKDEDGKVACWECGRFIRVYKLTRRLATHDVVPR